jgi:hypothetical protein
MGEHRVEASPIVIQSPQDRALSISLALAGWKAARINSRRFWVYATSPIKPFLTACAAADSRPSKDRQQGRVFARSPAMAASRATMESLDADLSA